MPGLAERLTDAGYAALFFAQPPGAAALWREAGMPAALAALADDPVAPEEARFLAAEIIAAEGPPPPNPARRAGAYAAGLRATRQANLWGLPGQADTAAARHLIGLGEAAVPALLPLLADKRRAWYAGSEDATVGNAAQWRICDLAATMVAAIRGGTFDASLPPEVRDAAIARLN
jgi:hypothetical protein